MRHIERLQWRRSRTSPVYVKSFALIAASAASSGVIAASMLMELRTWGSARIAPGKGRPAGVGTGDQHSPHLDLTLEWIASTAACSLGMSWLRGRLGAVCSLPGSRRHWHFCCKKLPLRVFPLTWRERMTAENATSTWKRPQLCLKTDTLDHSSGRKLVKRCLAATSRSLQDCS